MIGFDASASSCFRAPGSHPAGIAAHPGNALCRHRPDVSPSTRLPQAPRPVWSICSDAGSMPAGGKSLCDRGATVRRNWTGQRGQLRGARPPPDLITRSGASVHPNNIQDPESN